MPSHGNIVLSAKSAILRHLRHQGVISLARRVLSIASKEGISGITARLRFVLAQSRGASIPADPPGSEHLSPARTACGEASEIDHSARECSVSPSTQKPSSSASVSKANLLPGILLVGHPYGILGRGEDVRTAASACARVSLPFSLRNTFGNHGEKDAAKHKDFQLMNKISTERFHKTNVFFLNADEMDHAYQHLGSAFFEGRYNIGCWAWELSRFPEQWCGALRYLDELWAPSRFIQQALSEKANCPVLWMPFAIEPVSSIRLSRSYFDLPEDKFLFLFFFDFRSYLSRKNPQAAIHAFLKAFEDRGHENVRLIIKTNGMDACPDDYQRFLEMQEIKDPRVTLINRIMDDQEIKELVRLCDCFVSLHRAEGFGRGLAEAMYFGKPVIATGYSGNLDFMNEMNSCLVDHVLIPVGEGEYPYGAGQLWADPDIEQAAWYMRRLIDRPSYAAEVGTFAQKYIKTYHSFESIGYRYKRRIHTLRGF